MLSFFKSACLAALISAGSAFAGAINNSDQPSDPSDLSLSMDGSVDPRVIVNADSQPVLSKQDMAKGPSLNAIEVQTDAVPTVPEPSTVILVAAAGCAAFIGRRKFARA